MKTKTGISVLFLIALFLTACGPKLAPGQVSGSPDRIYYGGCSPSKVEFSLEWPSGHKHHKYESITVWYHLLISDGRDLLSSGIGLNRVPLDPTISGPELYTGELDINAVLGVYVSYLLGGEGSLVYYAEATYPGGSVPVPGGTVTIPETEFRSDSKVVDVQPCLPTPTPTPTAIEIPTKKPKDDRPSCSVEPNNPNCKP